MSLSTCLQHTPEPSVFSFASSLTSGLPAKKIKFKIAPDCYYWTCKGALTRQFSNCDFRVRLGTIVLNRSLAFSLAQVNFQTENALQKLMCKCTISRFSVQVCLHQQSLPKKHLKAEWQQWPCLPWTMQGILNEGEGSVLLTSSLWWLFCKKLILFASCIEDDPIVQGGQLY